jgi:hypothetical protein
MDCVLWTDNSIRRGSYVVWNVVKVVDHETKNDTGLDAHLTIDACRHVGTGVIPVDTDYAVNGFSGSIKWIKD